LLADYITVVEDRPIMSVKYCLPVPVFHFWPKLMYPAARSLCDSWASCLYSFTAVTHQYLLYVAIGRLLVHVLCG